MNQIVIMRHGESFWNLENRFSGWSDVELDDEGHFEALRAGHYMRTLGLRFTVVFTSLLKRAIHTADLSLDIMDQTYVPMIKDWRLNERHYGALQGLNKSETALRFGESQVFVWRRSYNIPPAPLDETSFQKFAADPKFASVPKDKLPHVETLQAVVERVIPFWDEVIVPAAKQGQQVLVVAHGNSLRAILKYVEHISDENICNLNLPTGVPIVLKFDDKWNYVGRDYLGNADEIAAAIKKVESQGHAMH